MLHGSIQNNCDVKNIVTALATIFSLVVGIEAYPIGIQFRGDLPDCETDYSQSIYIPLIRHNCFGTWSYTEPAYPYADGSRYVGEFRNDVRHGFGTFISSDGSRYVGEWKNDKKHGKGTYTLTDGSIKKGIFANGEFLYEEKPDPPVVTKESPKPQNQIKKDPDKMISASSGSGFAITNSGHVITNNHVIEGCQNVKIHSKGQIIPATVLTFDPSNDIALLKGDFLPTTVFSLSDAKPELLQDIYVAGYPFGQQISTSVKVTKGIVSSLTGIGNNFSNIQIDAALQPGNSGGPILDDKGNVLGVAVAKLDLKKILEDYGTIPENTNFGVKTSVVRSITDSVNVSLPKPNRSDISKSELGQMITDGTYYLSCWMTMAQINQMKSKKVIFQNLNLD